MSYSDTYGPGYWVVVSKYAPVEGVSPAAPRVGLVASAARPVDPPGTRWEAGLSWAPNLCGAHDAVDPCNPGTFEPVDADDIADYDPVMLWAEDRCRATDQAQRNGSLRAQQLLEADTSRLLARELWTGNAAAAAGFPNASLASPAANTLTNGELGVIDGLACLEEGLAVAGVGRGMIHVTPGLAAHLTAAGLIFRDGSQVVTIQDTLVVADAGYDGSGPNGEPAVSGSVWAYGTGIVSVRLGAIRGVPTDLSEALDRVKDTVTWYATRVAAATFDPCRHVAAEFNVPRCADLAGS